MVRILAGLSMSEMVVSANYKAFQSKEAKEWDVAVDMFAHSMGNLDYPAQRCCGLCQAAEQVLPITGRWESKGLP